MENPNNSPNSCFRTPSHGPSTIYVQPQSITKISQSFTNYLRKALGPWYLVVMGTVYSETNVPSRSLICLFTYLFFSGLLSPKFRLFCPFTTYLVDPSSQWFQPLSPFGRGFSTVNLTPDSPLRRSVPFPNPLSYTFPGHHLCSVDTNSLLSFRRSHRPHLTRPTRSPLPLVRSLSLILVQNIPENTVPSSRLRYFTERDTVYGRLCQTD